MNSNNEVFEEFIHIKKTIDEFVLFKNKEPEEILFWDEHVPSEIDFEKYVNVMNAFLEGKLPFDVEEYVLHNSIFIVLDKNAKTLERSYRTLLNTPINWVFSKPNYVYPRGAKNKQDITVFKSKDSESFINLQKNVQYHFLAKLLLSATATYPDFKRKEHILKSLKYAYENVGVSDFRHMVSSNVNTEDIEYCLSNDYPIYSSLLAYNKNIDESVYEELSKDSEVSVIHSLLRQKALSSKIIGDIYKNHKEDRLVNILVVIHKNCPDFIIEELFNSDDDELRDLAMMNPHFDETQLCKIANGVNLVDKRIVAKNSSTPLTYIEEWLNNEDEDPAVRFNAFCNESLPSVYKNIYSI